MVLLKVIGSVELRRLKGAIWAVIDWIMPTVNQMQKRNTQMAILEIFPSNRNPTGLNVALLEEEHSSVASRHLGFLQLIFQGMLHHRH